MMLRLTALLWLFAGLVVSFNLLLTAGPARNDWQWLVESEKLYQGYNFDLMFGNTAECTQGQTDLVRLRKP